MTQTFAISLLIVTGAAVVLGLGQWLLLRRLGRGQGWWRPGSVISATLLSPVGMILSEAAGVDLRVTVVMSLCLAGMVAVWGLVLAGVAWLVEAGAR